MARKSNALDEENTAIRSRLNSVVARFSQAEIARRTGAPKANIHRYLNEGRVPTSFCAALVKEFQINPVWLLSGEGGMLRSEVGVPITKLGEGILDLVEAMNAVARMRLGALTGRPDQKKLRELADAFSAFESLREKLNEASRPILKATLAEARPTLLGMDLERGGSLLQSASQLGRMCLDDDLLENLDMLQGMHAYLSGRVGDAVGYGRRVFGRRMREGRIRGPEDLQTALEVAFQIRDTGRLREARRMLRAALCLDEARAREPDHLRARLFSSSISVELGELDVALAEDLQVYAPIAGKYADCDMLHARTRLMTGEITWHEAAAGRNPGTMLYRMLLRHACVLEDKDMLGEGLKRFVGRPPDGLPEREYDTQLAILVHKLLSGKRGKVSDYDRLLDEHPPRLASRGLVDVMTHLHRGQVARLAGDARALRQSVLATREAREAVPEDQLQKIDWLLTEKRNLDGLSGKRLPEPLVLARQTVTTQVDHLIKAGYNFLSA